MCRPAPTHRESRARRQHRLHTGVVRWDPQQKAGKGLGESLAGIQIHEQRTTENLALAYQVSRRPIQPRRAELEPAGERLAAVGAAPGDEPRIVRRSPQIPDQQAVRRVRGSRPAELFVDDVGDHVGIVIVLQVAHVHALAIAIERHGPPGRPALGIRPRVGQHEALGGIGIYDSRFVQERWADTGVAEPCSARCPIGCGS